MGGGLFLSGVDVETMGARVAPQQGHESSPTFADNVDVAALGRIGDTLLDDYASLPDIQRRVVLDIRQDTPELLLATIDALKVRTLVSQLRVAFGDRATRCHTARCGKLELEYFGPAQGAYDARVALPLTLSPLRYKCTALGEFDPTVLALQVGMRTSLPAGTGVSDLRFLVSGGGATLDGFSIVVRRFTGEEAFRMVFSGSLNQFESLIVDSNGSLIKKLTGVDSTTVDGFSFWSGPFTAVNDFPVLRPGDAALLGQLWATAELESGASGTPSGFVEYVETYL